MALIKGRKSLVLIWVLLLGVIANAPALARAELVLDLEDNDTLMTDSVSDLFTASGDSCGLQVSLSAMSWPYPVRIFRAA